MSCGCTHAVVVPARTGVTAYPGAASEVFRGGTSVVALYGPLAGGIVQNPGTTQEQGIEPIVPSTPTTRTRRVGALNSYAFGSYVPLASYRTTTTTTEVDEYGPPELLYLSIVGPVRLTLVTMAADDASADTSADFGGAVDAPVASYDAATTIVLLPGQSYTVPPNSTNDVWVNALTSGHRFTAIAVQPVTPYPPVPYAGAFPPAGPTTKTTTIPSYLYQEYQDDDDLQALVAAYNQSTQAYLDAFNGLNLPVYTGLSGALLDWVANGLYGVARPTLYSGRYRSVGALDTAAFNTLAFNVLRRTSTFTDVAVTSDDVYKRVVTWHVFRGDGRQVAAQWLKRRIVRFLYGAGGADASGSARQVSVVFSGGAVTVTIVTGIRRVTGGALNTRAFNTAAPNTTTSVLTMLATPALATVLKEAIDTGALEMPEQYVVTCRVGTIGVR